ncbi:heme exporter protein CcmD [Alteromonadaceae bacterium BrNp21-10]|nr:heme exporter protein CcmD [Alteromonadaceae bacterium BrNp21-10]
MAFDNIAAFLNMGGYGFYVWLAYGISILAVVAIAVSCILNRRLLWREALNEMQRKQRIQQAQTNQNNSKESMQ